MQQAQLRQLRDELPPFVGLGLEPTGLAEFCRFYGIDFSTRFPGVQHRVGTVPSGSFSLAVHRWLLPGATSTLLIVHGYFDHTGLYGKLIEFGLANNCNVLMFDLPGHGLSSGEAAVIDDFADYGQAIKAVLDAARPPDLPLWAMAQSTGCAALVEYARNFQWPFAATVLLAPLLRPAGWAQGRVVHAILRYFTSNIKRQFSKNSSDPAFLEFIRRDPLQAHRLSLHWVAALGRWLASLPRGDLGVGPVLLVQGDADRTVDWRYNVEAYRKLFPGSQVQMLPGAGHQLANETAAIRQRYFSAVAIWLADALAKQR